MNLYCLFMYSNLNKILFTLTRWTTNPGVKRPTPTSPVFRMRLSTKVPSSFDLVVGGTLTLLHSEGPKLHRVLAILSVIELNQSSFSLSAFRYSKDKSQWPYLSNEFLHNV